MKSDDPIELSTGIQPRKNVKKIFKAIGVTGLTLFLLAAFLSPFLFMVFTSLKSPQQMSAMDSPIWPAKQATYSYQGQDMEIFNVPMPDGTTKALAMLKPGRTSSVFVDPANPDAGEIVWDGSWRTLKRPWMWAPRWQNFIEVWQAIDFPRLLGNTLFLAITTEIGMLVSCTMVAYGFARFRFPRRNLLFTLMIATVFLPSAVTTIPTYTFFLKIGWVGTYLPLIIPAFFANAYDVFLLRQFFLTIPREMDEAAMMDGASSFRIFWSIILPQSTPVLVAVSVFHIVWSWNNYYDPLIYLSTKPELQPIAVAMARFNGIHSTNPHLIQATALMALIVPLIIFLAAQRFFMQGIVITGVEK
ncbi:MAG TPA: carbohydrate ABC transporter permease [Longilinea sp.]|nr:carbohydrate ABC transporter permease [Longilinea sp.]